MKKIITYSFYLLFFLTPLIFTPLNYELFEYNKMMLVYLLTIWITGAWIILSVREKRLIFQKTPLDIPILLFLISQILSTIFSIDHHTSIWGYYSRSNGGLLSTFSYILLYYAFISNFKGQKDQIIRFLKSALWGGLVVALWAIPEHFGYSPSCLLLTNHFNDSCWVQDVQSRVFATLGQPNWLAAYLSMLIFPTIYFFIQAKSLVSRLSYLIFLILFYLAFTFTFSRGATLGLVAGIGVFLSFWLVQNRFWSRRSAPPQKDIKLISLVILFFLIVNLIFGSALTRFKLITQSAPPAPPSSSTQVSQLENGGTESSQIRLIVWKGAFDIFKHYPIFGSGVETFAYSYYLYRPVEHNLVSEWDFLYNKAHNEYLNYLSTTGAVGFLTYMLMIGTFIVWAVKGIMNQESRIKKDEKGFIIHHSSFIIALLASYLSYLVQNFFQFSVVIISVLFYLIPAFVFSFEEKLILWPFPELKLPNSFIIHHSSFISQKPLTQRLTNVIVILLVLFLNFTLIKYWLADTHYNKGTNLTDAGEAGSGYNQLLDAAYLNPHEPLYQSELGYAAATAAVALSDRDATLSGSLKQTAINQTDQALSTSPHNTSIWRAAIRTYYELSNIDSSYNQKTLDAVNKTITLAPTDPKLLYNKALILGQLNQASEAVNSLQQAVKLKPNYRDAYFALGVFYQQLGQKDQAISEYNIVLKLIPHDPDATEKLKSLQ